MTKKETALEITSNQLRAPMRRIRQGLLAALCVCAGAATATPVTATLSYTFDSTHVFTGSLSGELHDQGTSTTSDDYIDGVTGLTAQLNGVNLRGSLFMGAYDSSGRRDDLPARLYLDISLLSAKPGFIVANCSNLADCTAAASAGNYNYFFLRTGASPNANFFDRLTGNTDVDLKLDSTSAPAWHLSVSAVTNPPPNDVPEPGSLAMVALGLAGAACSQRRKNWTGPLADSGHRSLRDR